MARVPAFLDSLGFTKLSLHLDTMKFEVRSTKSETNSTFQLFNAQNRDGVGESGNSCLDHLDFGHWDLPFDLAQGGEPFDSAQGRESVERSFDSAQDRELVERLVEPFRIWKFGFRL